MLCLVYNGLAITSRIPKHSVSKPPWTTQLRGDRRCSDVKRAVAQRKIIAAGYNMH